MRWSLWMGRHWGKIFQFPTTTTTKRVALMPAGNEPYVAWSDIPHWMCSVVLRGEWQHISHSGHCIVPGLNSETNSPIHNIGSYGKSYSEFQLPEGVSLRTAGTVLCLALQITYFIRPLVGISVLNSLSAHSLCLHQCSTFNKLWPAHKWGYFLPWLQVKLQFSSSLQTGSATREHSLDGGPTSIPPCSRFRCHSLWHSSLLSFNVIWNPEPAIIHGPRLGAESKASESIQLVNPMYFFLQFLFLSETCFEETDWN